MAGGFKIVRDHWQEKHGDKSNVGRESAVPYDGGTMRVRVMDDDGEVYYEADCDGDDGAELFHDWAQGDSGCVRSQYRDGRAWKEFIS